VVIRLLTWNIGKQLSKDRARDIVKVIRSAELDFTLLQEVPPNFAYLLTDNNRLGKGYTVKVEKRLKADAQEGTYIVIYKNVYKLKNIEFGAEIEIRPIPDLDRHSPPVRVRPPLRMRFKRAASLPIILYTWHAPHGGMMAKVGSQEAMTAIRSWKRLIKDDLDEAKSGLAVWILAADLNVRSGFLRDVFTTNLGFRYAKTSTDSLDHVIAYPKKMATSIKVLKTTPQLKSPRDHDSVCVAITFGEEDG
jgi:endonuclease/exonuclease/phosphatase family metal-dependent hydrolase